MARAIDLMHRRFGRSEGKTCGECPNIREYSYGNHNVRKCLPYGGLHSSKADWAKRWPACGLFGHEETRQVVSDGEKSRFFRGIGPEAQPEEPLEGQIEMEAVDGETCGR